MIILGSDDEGLARAAALIRQSRPVAFPTETVYGLGALASDERGVAAIFAAKDRPPDNPLIVHVASADEVLRVAASFPLLAQKLADRFWPGPLALVLPRNEQVPAIVSAGLATVAVRQPAHPVALALILAAGFPLAAPSANRSGRPSPTSAAHVQDDLEGRIEAVVDGGSCAVGLESTVLDLSGPVPRLLRPGGISPDQLAEVLGFHPEAATPASEAASPGTRHRHYQPRCELLLYEREIPTAAAGDGLVVLDEHAPIHEKDMSCWNFLRRLGSPEEYARELFSILRDADAASVQRLHLPWPAESGIGLALRDRIARAAGHT